MTTARRALADVDSLFASAGQSRQRRREERATEVRGEDGSGPGGADEPVDDEASVTASEWRESGTEAVDPLLGPVLKRAKRVAQDDQNALLDAVRRHKGRPTAQVLPDLEALARLGDVLRIAVDRAPTARPPAPGARRRGRLVREAADAVVSPLRLRITVAIDTGDASDPGGLVERIGALSRVEEPIARAPSPRCSHWRGREASTTQFPVARCCGGCRSRKADAPTATTTRSSRR